MNEELRQLVWDRAAGLCEYCRVPQLFDPLPFGIDHIRPQYHHGPSVAENLCLCCFQDNTFKAVNVAGYDPATGALSELFHPRREIWAEHFEFDGGRIVGATALGRTTVDVLRMNLPELVGVFAFGSCLLTELVTEHLAGNDQFYQQSFWALPTALLLAAIPSWIIGRKLNCGPVVVDPATGVQVRHSTNLHSFFFIPMQAWGWTLAAIAAAIAVYRLVA